MSSPDTIPAEFVEPITTVAEHRRVLDRLREYTNLAALPDDEYNRLDTEREALSDRLGTVTPLLDALRIAKYEWDRAVVPPPEDDDGGLLLDRSWNSLRDDSVTTAEDIRWLVEALADEVLRLRPELSGDGDE